MPLGIPHSTFLSWDPDDQDKALAHIREAASVCSGCGTRDADWSGPDEWIADTYRCPGCKRIAEEQEQVPEKEHGVRVYLRRYDPARDD